MEHLTLFQTHQDYEAFVSGGTMVRPNISHCISENDVHYNPIIPPIYPNPGLTDIEEIRSFVESWYRYQGDSEKADFIHNATFIKMYGSIYGCIYTPTGQDITYDSTSGEIEEFYS